MTFPFGIDIGSHLVINKETPEMVFDVLAVWDLDIKFCLIRSHLGTWADPSYYPLRREAERVGFLVGTWPVLSPTEPTGPQVDKWLIDVPAPGPMRRWIDFERVGTRIPSPYQLQTSARMIEDHDNQPAGIYTRAQLINDNLGSISATKLNSWDYWLAQYLTLQTIRGEYPPEYMTVPKRVQRERIHILQTASKLPGPYGAVPNAKALDRNRWVSMLELSEFAEQGTTPPPPPSVTIEGRIETLESEARLHGWNI